LRASIARPRYRPLALTPAHIRQRRAEASQALLDEAADARTPTTQSKFPTHIRANRRHTPRACACMLRRRPRSDHQMTLPRSSLVSTESTRFYHCISRCVRRAFLCGVDSVTGQSFEHRRQWLVERLALLERLFAVDVCAYCAMSNHSHLVLRLNPDEAAEWSGDEVLERWCTLFSGPTLVQRYRARDNLGAAELRAVSELVERYRARLCDLSWFMRCPRNLWSIVRGRAGGSAGDPVSASANVVWLLQMSEPKRRGARATAPAWRFLRFAQPAPCCLPALSEPRPEGFRREGRISTADSPRPCLMALSLCSHRPICGLRARNALQGQWTRGSSDTSPAWPMPKTTARADFGRVGSRRRPCSTSRPS